MKLVLAAALVVSASAMAVPTTMITPASGAGAARTVAAPVAGTDACGIEPLKPDGTPWTCTFDDEFNAAALDRQAWLPQTAFVTGTPDAYACYVDSPATVSVSGGSLNLSVRRAETPTTCETAPPSPYVAGMVTTYHLFSQQYGRVEARIRNTATTDPGLHEAFWLWPDDRYPAPFSLFPGTGEIDVSETYSVFPTLSVPYLHYNANLLGLPEPGVNTAWTCTVARGTWNTYTVEWSPSRVEILVNGATCLVNTSADPAFQRHYIIALTAALGNQGNGYDGRALLPATMNVDYVRAWQ
jgi:beta-glucanase (GH16 family)